MSKYLLSIILMVNLAGWGYTYTIPPIEFELLENKFRLSIANDPDIKCVGFNVNINKEFRSFETGQLIGMASAPINEKWIVEFDKALKDSDLVYVWLVVQHNRLIFRDKKETISVKAFKSGNPNYTISTTTESGGDISTDTSLKKNIDVNLEKKICRPTVTQVPKSFGGPYCRDDLIFSDNFDTLNTKYWTNEIRFPPTIDDAEYVLYNGSLAVEGGVLKIEAHLNDQHLREDSIDLGERCTSINVEKECSVTPRGVLILPPVISGRLSTKNYFNFKYGRIEVRAKLPIGDWLFPLISLEPSASTYVDRYKSGEMRIAYARGNHNLMWKNKNINGARLFGGVIINKHADMRHEYMNDTTLPNVNHFGDEFHLYTLTWKPDQLILAVDGNEYGRIETNLKEHMKKTIWNKCKDALFNQMFYITLGLAAGGNGDFPNTYDKPWVNGDPRGSWSFYKNRNAWFPTWSQPSLEVDYVKVYAV